MTTANTYQQTVIDLIQVTIASSGDTSTAAVLHGTTIAGIYIGTFTGTEISFEASFDGSTFFTVHDGLGVALTRDVASDIYLPLDPANFYGIRFIKVKSNLAEVAERTLNLVPYSI